MTRMHCCFFFIVNITAVVIVVVTSVALLDKWWWLWGVLGADAWRVSGFWAGSRCRVLVHYYSRYRRAKHTNQAAMYCTCTDSGAIQQRLDRPWHITVPTKSRLFKRGQKVHLPKRGGMEVVAPARLENWFVLNVPSYD